MIILIINIYKVMKKILLSLLVAYFTLLEAKFTPCAADTFNVTTAGTLEQLVNNAVNDSITELTITGTINWKDLKFISSCSGRVKALQVIDLTDVTIEESEDSCYATRSGLLVSSGMMDSWMGYFYYSNTPRYEKKYTSTGLGGLSTTLRSYNNDLGGLFVGMSTLRKVRLPKTTSNIGERCFQDCSSLEDIELPSQLKYVGEGAFFNCGKLPNVLPNTLDSIGDYSCYNCGSMTGALDLSSARRIGYAAFSFCSFSSVTLSKSLESLNAFYSNTKLTTVNIPSDGSLKDISGFTGCESLKSISLPNSVSYIGADAFHGCYSLAQVTLPNSITEIKGSTFEYCTALKEISIPDGVTTIGGRAFSNCTALTKVELPSALTSVATTAFDNTPYYKSLPIKNNFVMVGNVIIAYNGDYSEKTITLPENTVTIMNVFNNSKGKCEKITEIVLPEGLKRIEQSCFSSFSGISELTIPQSVEFIGISAFNSCSGLKKVYYNPSECVLNGGINMLEQSIDGSFRNCDNLSEFVIGDNVRKLPIFMFYSLKALKTVTFSPSSSLKEIGKYAFTKSGITRIELPETVDTIATYAFYNCPNLVEANIPANVKWYDRIFQDCSQLAKLNYNAKNMTFTKATTKYFDKCPIDTLAIGKDVVEIPKEMMYKKSTLKTLTFPSVGCSLTTIGEFAFMGTSIDSINIPSTVTTICDEAFARTKLKKVFLTESIDSLGSGAFESCDSLRECNIPKSITKLYDPYYYCKNLEVLYYYPTDATGYGVCNYLKKLVVGEEVETLRTYFGDSLAEVQFINPENIRYVGDCFMNTIWRKNMEPDKVHYVGSVALFYNKETTTDCSIEIKEGTTLIANGFVNAYSPQPLSNYNTRYIKSISLPKSLEEIGAYSFQGTGFNEIRIPEGLKKIGEGALNWTLLKEVTLPNGIKDIPYNLFYVCTELEKVTLGNNIQSIGGMAFSLCSCLKDIYIYTPEPCVPDENAFYAMNTTNITLHVPDNSYDAYSNAEIWKDFNIVADLTTSIENIRNDDSSSSIRLCDNGIIVDDNGSEVKVYTPTGGLIYSGWGGKIKLNQGMYIVNVGVTSRKIIIK